MIKSKITVISILIAVMSIVSGCKTKEYIEVPVEVEKTKIEYVHKLDSIYLHDSVSTYIILRGDTVFIDRYKYKIREVYKTDTVHKIDSIPKIVTINKIVEVNKLSYLLKILMSIGGVGVISIVVLLMYKLKIWKLLF